MKIYWIKLLVVLTLIFVYSKSYAGCEKPSPGYDSVYCSAKLFLESDNELNASWKQLLPLLSTDQRKSIMQVQRDWIKYRASKCSENNSIDVDCNYILNKERTKFILDRITECKIGGCKDALLIKAEWR